MIKSRQLHISSNGDDTDEVLAEVESFANEMKLPSKDALRVRLLAEETLSMLTTMTGETEYAIEFVGNSDRCILKLETDTLMDAMKKDALLSVSSTGRNIYVKGIMGKIRDVFETAFTMPSGGVWTDNCALSMMMGYPGDMYSAQFMDSVYWSLESYRNSVDAEDVLREEEKDELEKSIVSNIADDVQVGVREGHVAMNIIYKLQ